MRNYSTNRETYWTMGGEAEQRRGRPNEQPVPGDLRQTTSRTRAHNRDRRRSRRKNVHEKVESPKGWYESVSPSQARRKRTMSNAKKITPRSTKAPAAPTGSEIAGDRLLGDIRHLIETAREQAA
jgi:hypothetical protein